MLLTFFNVLPDRGAQCAGYERAFGVSTSAAARPGKAWEPLALTDFQSASPPTARGLLAGKGDFGISRRQLCDHATSTKQAGGECKRASGPLAFFQASSPPPMWHAVVRPASCAACTAMAERSPKAQ